METLRLKAAAARLMGDMNDAGDAPFGGEVRLDSKVGHSLPLPCQSDEIREGRSSFQVAWILQWLCPNQSSGS